MSTDTLAQFIAGGRRLAANPPKYDRARDDRDARKALPELRRLVLACPFCGKLPRIGPTKPSEEGSAWGIRGMRQQALRRAAAGAGWQLNRR
jgi:hypothetical protein